MAIKGEIIRYYFISTTLHVTSKVYPVRRLCCSVVDHHYTNVPLPTCVCKIRFLLVFIYINVPCRWFLVTFYSSLEKLVPYN